MTVDTKTEQALSHVVDYLTAAIGWVDLSNRCKAVAQIKLALAVIYEIQQALLKIEEDLSNGAEEDDNGEN